MLVVHFLGLTMGLGTSFGYLFLGVAASKMEAQEAKEFTLKTMSLSKMGQLGIILLILSGGYLITPYWPVLQSMPLLVVKLILVAVLVVVIILLTRAGKKAQKGNFEAQVKKIKILGKISLLTAVAIVILAVLNFR